MSVDMEQTCTKCGKPVTGKFCSECGTPVRSAQAEETKPIKKCRNCGAVVPGNFCPACGKAYVIRKVVRQQKTERLDATQEVTGGLTLENPEFNQVIQSKSEIKPQSAAASEVSEEQKKNTKNQIVPRGYHPPVTAENDSEYRKDHEAQRSKQTETPRYYQGRAVILDDDSVTKKKKLSAILPILVALIGLGVGGGGAFYAVNSLKSENGGLELPEPVMKLIGKNKTEPETETAPAAVSEPETKTAPAAVSEPETKTAPAAVSEPETETAPAVVSEPETETAPAVVSESETEAATAAVSESETETEETTKAAATEVIPEEETSTETETESALAETENPLPTDDEIQAVKGQMTLNEDHSLSFQGHRYVICDTSDWNLPDYVNMEHFSESLGGHLAVITSQEENIALAQWMTELNCPLAFMGLSDADQEGSWAWITKETFEYHNWAAGQPGKAENADLAQISSEKNGSWNPADFAENTTKFICEWENEEEINAEALQMATGAGMENAEVNAEAAGNVEAPKNVEDPGYAQAPGNVEAPENVEDPGYAQAPGNGGTPGNIGAPANGEVNVEALEQNQSSQTQQSNAQGDDSFYSDGTVVMPNSYIMPESETKYLTEADVRRLSHKGIRYAINELYARHGFSFKLHDTSTYFDAQSWYKRDTTDMSLVVSRMNDYEKQNKDYLSDMELILFGYEYPVN